jgi:hypothetical protein
VKGAVDCTGFARNIVTVEFFFENAKLNSDTQATFVGASQLRNFILWLSQRNPGEVVKPFLALALVAAQAQVLCIAHATIPIFKPVRSAVAEPVFLKMPEDGGGLTLYNAKGEVVARCDRKGDSFANCKMEPGVTLDDVMNAWVRAYQDPSK